jgi:hypothetical protein
VIGAWGAGYVLENFYLVERERLSKVEKRKAERKTLASQFLEALLKNPPEGPALSMEKKIEASYQLADKFLESSSTPEKHDSTTGN